MPAAPVAALLRCLEWGLLLGIRPGEIPPFHVSMSIGIELVEVLFHQPHVVVKSWVKILVISRGNNLTHCRFPGSEMFPEP